MPIPFQFEPALVTEAPLSVGLRLTVEGPGRLRLTSSAGLLPDAYLQGINDVATHYEWWDDQTAELITVALDGALVIRNHLGWRPFAKLGLNVEAGYGFVGLGGGITGSEVLSIVTGYDIPDEVGGGLSFSANAVLHMADVTLGWDQALWKRLHLRVDLGAAFTLASQTTIEPDFEVAPLAEGFVDELCTRGEEALDEEFQTYVHLPTAAVSLGWRF